MEIGMMISDDGFGIEDDDADAEDETVSASSFRDVSLDLLDIFGETNIGG